LTAGTGVTGWRAAGVDEADATGDDAGWVFLQPKTNTIEAIATSADRVAVLRFDESFEIMEWDLPCSSSAK
jgi:hypothetical protein